MLRVLIGLCLSFLVFSCQKKEVVQSDCKTALGLDLNKPVTKVISLSPALSEWIAYFELDTFLIARSAYCNYPERLLSKKVVSAYPISTEELMALQPDVVLVQEGLNDADQVNALRKAGMHVLTVPLNGPKDVKKLDSLLRFCLDWNTGNHAAHWLNQFEEDKAHYDTLLPTMVLIEPTQLYVFGKGTYLSALLNQAGYHNVMENKVSQSFLSIDRETFVNAAPAVILHSQKDWTEAAFLQRYPEWKVLFANGTRLHYIPADWLMRPGPRMLTLLTELKRARLD
jgi:iron complex transport system substrate-binding protein